MARRAKPVTENVKKADLKNYLTRVGKNTGRHHSTEKKKTRQERKKSCRVRTTGRRTDRRSEREREKTRTGDERKGKKRQNDELENHRWRGRGGNVKTGKQEDGKGTKKEKKMKESCYVMCWSVHRPMSISNGRGS